ncbi:MAG: hypothetical protein ACERLG_06260 [Sedimentibacter sp.]
MDNYRPENIAVGNEKLNVQCDKKPKGPYGHFDENIVAGTGGIDSSLLFFFLILVCIVCQSDCGISMDTLLWFFLLLVVLYNQFDL